MVVDRIPYTALSVIGLCSGLLALVCGSGVACCATGSASLADGDSLQGVTSDAPRYAGNLIQPADVAYLGAFRLPDGPPDIGWEWSGSALTYYPDGDPAGAADKYPGSLFGTGHDWNQWVSEISIPMPVISPGKKVNDLNTAVTLQSFSDIRSGLGEWPMELPRVGLEYMPALGGQSAGKLYFAWAPHMGEGETRASHGWCGLSLSNPQSAGLWRVGNYWNYVTGDYLFAIPQAWADTHVPGKYLATGRYREGGQGAQGPSMIAISPWNEGNPSPPNRSLAAVPLLLYDAVTESSSHKMANYHHSDEWSGAAWLTSSDRSAVVFVGTKGTGNCWYGCADGTVWEPPYPPGCPDGSERGWWSSGLVGQILFYDPADLGAVARGTAPAWSPQPYAVMNIDQYLFHVASGQQKCHVGAVAFDRARGLLYIMEPHADGDKPLVHAWTITTSSNCVPPAITSHPQGQTIESGESVVLQVVATGTGPFTCQWYRGTAGNTSVPVGTGLDTYTTPPLTTNAQYWVRVRNACGSADSTTATITVSGGGTAPLITGTRSKKAKPGTGATIYITGHSTDKSRLTVYFGTVRATKIKKLTPKLIKTIIPVVRAGTVQVYVVSDGVESNRVDFRIR